MSKLEEQIAEAEAEGEGDEEGGDEQESPLEGDEEGEEADADEGEPAPEPEAKLDPSTHAIVKQLEGEHTRRRKALEKIMGPDFAAYQECPLCAAMGYVVGTPLVQDTKVQRCPHCAGHGAVLTGAAQDAEMVRQCPACLGLGHVPTEAPSAPVVQFSTSSANSANPPPPKPDPAWMAEARAGGYMIVPPIEQAS